MYKKYRVYIESNQKWINVTDKKIVIYGTGNSCFEMLNTFQLANIAYVVDGDLKKQGLEILIQNKTYKIQSPDILRYLDMEQYFVIISTALYEKEIRTKIYEICQRDIFVCLWNKELFYCYQSIEDMLLYDPVMNKKLLKLNLCFYRMDIIEEFYRIKAEVFDSVEIRYFIPVLQGTSKIVFLFGDQKQTWVYSIRGKNVSMNEIEICKSNEYVFQKRYMFIQAFLRDEFTIFSNETGVLIQKYAKEEIDFADWDTKKRIVQECRRMHTLDVVGLEESNFVAGVLSFYKDNVKKMGIQSLKLIDDANKLVEKCIESIERVHIKRVIHQDLTCSNIVSYNNKIVFIDLESIAVGNPMIDICCILYSIQGQYLGGKCTFEEFCLSCFKELSLLLQIYCDNDQKEFETYIDAANAVMCLYILLGISGLFEADWEKACEQMRVFRSVALEYI